MMTNVPETGSPAGAQSADASDEVAFLLSYLRGRNAACPRCGYNLRDLARPICPECRAHLSLSVGVRELHFGWFIATIAPGIFSGMAGILLLGILTIDWYLGGGVPGFIKWVDAFGLLSGAAAVTLFVERNRFIRLPRLWQAVAAGVMWAIHVIAFVVVLALRL